MINITIGWEWALGIFGMLILVAWKGSARLAALETSMEWVKTTLNDLKVTMDNAPRQVFGAGSPIDLRPAGLAWLNDSGLKAYIDANSDKLLTICEKTLLTNPYEVQRHIFSMFDALQIAADVEDRVKKFAYEQGTTMSTLRRVGAIYLRNLYFERFEHHTSP
jgi:hypothetical protein